MRGLVVGEGNWGCRGFGADNGRDVGVGMYFVSFCSDFIVLRGFALFSFQSLFYFMHYLLHPLILIVSFLFLFPCSSFSTTCSYVVCSLIASLFLLPISYRCHRHYYIRFPSDLI